MRTHALLRVRLGVVSGAMEETGTVNGAAVFAAHELTVQFGGITALDAVSLEVAAGEVVGVIGPNGAGKTTLFNVICGFVQPRSGTLEWKGQTLTKVRTNRLARLGIARTLQGVGLFPGLSVLENVMLGAQRFRRAGIASALLGLPRSDRDERALRERALAMLSELELLLLDEPAGGLGADEMVELGDRIRALRGSMAVMLVEHRIDLVMSACDRIVVLDFGRVIAQGDPATVRSDQRVLEAYLGGEGA